MRPAAGPTPLRVRRAGWCPLRIGEAGEPLGPEIFDLEQGANLLACRIGDDEAVQLCQRLQPGGKVGRLADDTPLLRRSLAERSADDNQTSGDPDPCL